MRHFRALLAPLCGALLAALVASPASARLLIEIDKSAQRMTVSQDGEPFHGWPVSTGMRAYETPSGAFTPFRLEKDHFSREWDDAPMPHSIFFTERGHAIHGTTHVRNIGRPASHGCVRLEPENARVLFDLVRRTGLANTRVVLMGETPEPRGPAMARRAPRTSGRMRAPPGSTGGPDISSRARTSPRRRFSLPANIAGCRATATGCQRQRPMGVRDGARCAGAAAAPAGRGRAAVSAVSTAGFRAARRPKWNRPPPRLLTERPPAGGFPMSAYFISRSRSPRLACALAAPASAQTLARKDLSVEGAMTIATTAIADCKAKGWRCRSRWSAATAK